MTIPSRTTHWHCSRCGAEQYTSREPKGDLVYHYDKLAGVASTRASCDDLAVLSVVRT